VNDDAKGVPDLWIDRVATERMILGVLLLRDGGIGRVRRQGLVPRDFLARGEAEIHSALSDRHGDAG
jgi:replicative DNA helicase